MMQKIFDIENEEDMDLLWSILPDDVVRITVDKSFYIENYYKFKRKDGTDKTAGTLFKINWHDKTEITRPVNYEYMIGCVGWFQHYERYGKELGILDNIDIDTKETPFHKQGVGWYEIFTPAKKSDLKFYGEQDE